MIRDDEILNKGLILNIGLNLLEITSVIFEFGHWMVSSDSELQSPKLRKLHLFFSIRLSS